MLHFADRLTAAIATKKTSLCVGLDPRWESLPVEIRRKHDDTTVGRASAFSEFCLSVLEIVAPLVPIVKPQSAFFETCGAAGMQALAQVLERAHHLGVMTILDAKRNDIASTAEAYADAAFRLLGADALTVNPYLGRDSIEPFLQVARPLGRGLFVLVRTSNPGAGQFQDLECQGRPIYVHVAEAVNEWSRENLGRCGFGDVGAVVGATSPKELKVLRGVLENAILLVPGYGAQGASAADTKAAFNSDGAGAVINSSRAILYPKDAANSSWEEAIETATRQAIDDLSFTP